MIIFKHPADIKSFLFENNIHPVTIGFVPTMGALHEGHIALVRRARIENDLLVCSIFVNPTQFNNPDDFKKYPHTLEKDILQLEKAGCDVLFIPSVEDMYPNGTAQPFTSYPLGYLEEVLEGKYRPGHFQGVCRVVHRLLDIVMPTEMYLGQKDFQQCMVVKKLMEIIGSNVKLVICATQRQPDGLALSSRNMRLTPDQQKKATAIFQVLNEIRENIYSLDPGMLKTGAVNTLTGKGFRVDYVEIAAVDNLTPVENRETEASLIALVAAYLNDVRLIDNLLLTDNN